MAGYNEYLAFGNEGVVDISAGTPRRVDVKTSGGGPQPHNNDKKGKTKKTVIAICVTAALVLGLGTGGFFVFSNMQGSAKEETQAVTEATTAPEFVFENDTEISGVRLTGKNMRQAQLLLDLNKQKFIKEIELNIDVNGEKVTLGQQDFDYVYNIEEVLNKAYTDAVNGVKNVEGKPISYEVTVSVTEESINKNVEEICKKYVTEPKNAYVSAFHPFSDERFEYAEAKAGLRVNEDSLRNQLINAFADGSSEQNLVADTETVEADVQIDDIKGKFVKLASYETYSTNTDDGTTNMKVSLAACNGSIIDPDEIWSFNECTGDSNLAENGYKSASVIVEGKLQEGVGGGICQSSSTIYNAAVRANMKIIERSNHTWASEYVPTGMDATIDYPNLDLQLQNQSDYQMFLECRESDNTLTATIWGIKSGNYDEITVHNSLGETSGNRYYVSASRIYWKDGKEIDREELPSSSYDTKYGVVFEEADNDSQVVS